MIGFGKIMDTKMKFRIDRMTGGRFGNRVLQYNNLMQMTHLFQATSSCVSWGDNLPGSSINDGSAALNEGKYHCFDSVSPWIKGKLVPEEITWKDFVSLDVGKYVDNKEYVLADLCLHNCFFKITKKDPNDFLKISKEYKVNFPESEVHVGIHLRGGDVITVDDGKEIHYPEYYRDSIELIEGKFSNTKYHVCTDDKKFESFVETVKYLEQRGLDYEIGSSDLFSDFSTLSGCDILIQSSSTFAICAGFIGKRKKIIHSKKWIERNIEHKPWNNKPTTTETRETQLSFDNFWVDLYNGGNEYYKLWRLI